MKTWKQRRHPRTKKHITISLRLYCQIETFSRSQALSLNLTLLSIRKFQTSLLFSTSLFPPNFLPPIFHLISNFIPPIPPKLFRLLPQPINQPPSLPPHLPGEPKLTPASSPLPSLVPQTPQTPKGKPLLHSPPLHSLHERLSTSLPQLPYLEPVRQTSHHIPSAPHPPCPPPPTQPPKRISTPLPAPPTSPTNPPHLPQSQAPPPTEKNPLTRIYTVHQSLP